MRATDNIVPLADVRLKDANRVGGKNASLGELIGELAAAGVRVPDGFATTTDAYRRFLQSANLEGEIARAIDNLNAENTAELAAVGSGIRKKIMAANLPDDLSQEICAAYAEMGDIAVAVRSSATAEDLPDASFAGQQETLLNVRGEERLLAAVKRVFASLFTDRAISYRAKRGFAADDAALSVGVQKMIRSDLSASGVMFTLDTESGFEDAVFITAVHGLGEGLVGGGVNPDEFYVYKPSLKAGRPAVIRRTLGAKASKVVFGDEENPIVTISTDEAERRRFSIDDRDAEELGRFALAIENHYGRHMDIEWAKDGADGGIYIVQARPETAKSRESGRRLIRYRVKKRGDAIAEGRAIGQKIGVGPARLVGDPSQMEKVRSGDVLVADMTDPDWEPVMKRAAAIVTNRGGRTCHAAIIARELGIPAVVGCGDATAKIADGQTVSACCAEGDSGRVYDGAIDFAIEEVVLAEMPPAPVKIQINMANPELAFDFARLPNDGVGLARLEFIIARGIGVHPRAVLDYANLPADLQREVRRRIAGYADPREFYVEKLTEGIATIAAAFYPKPVIVRLSDFKSNEYAGLVGGRRFEPGEENPMLGFRGAARYLSDSFRDCVALECEALIRAREKIGLENLQVMVPFVRTIDEARRTVDLLAEFGLVRGENRLKIIMMCEVPSNALLAEEFLEFFDGFSVGSNDLTQLTLALDRDSGLVAESFDERNDAVRSLIHRAVAACRKKGKYAGVCGQGPSDHLDFAEWLIAEGVSAISLNPDAVAETWLALAQRAKKC